MKATFYQRFGMSILALAVAAGPLVVLAARQALRDPNNEVRQWLPSGFNETQRYDWFVEHFASDELAVVSWPGATLDDPRLETVAQRLAAYTAPADGDADPRLGETRSPQSTADGPFLFRSVLTGAEAVAQLMAEPLALPRSEAIRRLQGTIVGSDGRSTALIATVSEAGAADRHAAVETIYRVADDSGVPRAQLRIGGPTVDSVALDNESARSRYLLSTLSVILALSVAWRCLKSLRLIVPVFLTALLCGALALALVHLTGNSMNLVMVSMPALVFVLAVSGSIHLTNYYSEELQQRGRLGAAERAVAAGWLPCTLTGVTTAIGLGSLGLSSVLPVRHFGIYSALGVLASLPLLFLVLPALLTLWPGNGGLRPRPEPPVPPAHRHWAHHLASIVARFHAPVTVLGVVLMVLSAAGLFRLETTVKLQNMFSPKSQVIADYQWLEDNISNLVPMEVVVRVRPQDSHPLLGRLALVDEVQQSLQKMPEVGGTMSAATFAPAVPGGGGARQIVQRTVIQRRLEEQRDQLSELGYLSFEGTDELWRISARVQALNSVDYGQFIEQLRQQVEPILDRHRAEGAEVSAVYTGVVPLVYQAQRVLLNDLTISFMAAFALTGVVMIVMLRGFGGGLLSMLPNAFPALLVFGAMGWTGRLLDIGSIMTASVALGIAVDDTIHFLSWFRRGLDAGFSRIEAIRHAYHHCAKAMLQTTLICGVGMAAFALSSFMPTARFAGLMITLLSGALLGDLILLPALLAGPLGRCFERTEPVAPPKAAPSGRDRRPTLPYLPQVLRPRPARAA